MLKVIIAGGRNFNNYALLKERMEFYLKDAQDVKVVSGRAPGADTLGEQYTKEKSYPVTRFTADWEGLVKAAGPARDKQMAQYADACVCFRDVVSRGTKNMIDQATQQGLKVRVVMY